MRGILCKDKDGEWEVENGEWRVGSCLLFSTIKSALSAKKSAKSSGTELLPFLKLN
jgi:hypothetical protein